MSWQTFFNMFQPGGNQGVQARQADIDAERQRIRQSAEDHDQRFADVMDAIGAQPVQSGMVHRRMYTPPVNMGDDYSDIPGVSGKTQIPATDGYVLDKADPTRIVTHKAADGQTVQWERPSVEQQQLRAAHMRLASLQNPQNREAMQVDQRQTAAGERLKSSAQAGGRLDAEATAAAGPGGMDIPSELDNVLPGISQGQNGERRRVLPKEFDDIVRAAGSYANYKSEADTRGKLKAPKVVRSELSRDDQGNQVQINTLDDNTVTEVPVKAKGVTAKKTENGVTPYQQFQMNRAGQTDAEKRVNEWQNKLDKLQSQSESLWAEKKAADDELESMNQQLTARTSGILGTGLGNGPILKGAQRFQLQSKINALKNKSTAAAAKATAIDTQKRQVDTVRRAIMKANGLDRSDTGTAGGAAAGTPQTGNAPKIATLGQVNAYAKKYGLSLESAQKAFEDDGITVGK